MLSPKENLLETIRKGGHPERLPVCFSPFRPIGGDPVFQFVRGNRVRGTNSYDRWGTYISFPEDQPAAIPIVTPENQVIRNIEEWRQYVTVRICGPIALRAGKLPWKTRRRSRKSSCP